MPAPSITTPAANCHGTHGPPSSAASQFSLPVLLTTRAGHRRFLVKIVNHFRKQAPYIELGNLQVSRDYSDVEDVIAAYLALLQSNARSEVVNICSGRAIALLDIISMMNEIAGYEIEVRVNPEFVRENEVLRLVGNPAKLRGLVTLPAPRPFSDTLRRMYEG